MQHAASHTTTVQPACHNQRHVLIGKQWYQLPELIPTNSNSGLHSCITSPGQKAVKWVCVCVCVYKVDSYNITYNISANKKAHMLKKQSFNIGYQKLEPSPQKPHYYNGNVTKHLCENLKILPLLRNCQAG